MSSIESTDDLTVGNDSELWRRVRVGELVVDAQGGQRPSSQAFQNLEGDKMSVFVADILLAEGKGARSILEGHDGYAVAGITAQLARDLGQHIVLAPEEGLGHAHLVGQKDKKTRRRFAKAATWVVPP